MMTLSRRFVGWTVLALTTLATARASADTATIDVDAAKPGPKINPRMYGIFLEEINHGVDGGLYAELIRNRAFEDGRPPDGYVLRRNRWVDARGFNSGYDEYGYEVDGLPFWSLVTSDGAKGAMHLEKTGGVSEASAYCLRLEVEDAAGGRVGVANEGFFGIGVAEGKKYSFSVYVRGGAAAPSLTVRLEDRSGEACSDEATIDVPGNQWTRLEATLTGTKDQPRARLVITADAAGAAWLDMVSLFPADTWRGRGLRPDIAQMIADLKPGFVRFPGGCVVEGGTIESAYNWKYTVGPVVERREQWGPWHYRMTHGMGVHEYLQFCEDLGAEPLWVGFAGQTCIFRERENLPMEEMGWVRDNFLDMIQYANGAPNTKWGRMRAEAGRPQPFGLQYVEIGNENEGPEYAERYRYIHEALKERHPELTYLADKSYRSPIEPSQYQIADLHYYNSPSWFLSNEGMFDGRDRNLPPAYLGEVAVTSQHGGPLRGNLLAALAEGAYLMGCERNADAVTMVSYAPLLAHVRGRSWGWHGMIYHDSTRVCGTASYHLWKLFSEYRPDYSVNTTVDYRPAEKLAIAGQVGIGTWDATAEFKDVRVEQNGKAIYESNFSVDAAGWDAQSGRWEVADGAYRQTRRGQGLSYFGQDDWSDYTLTLKARKQRGGEGFLVVFGRKGGDQYWWNLGGWGNARHAIEHNQTPVGRQRRGRIETDRWYDVKIEVEGAQIRCYLDGELVHDETATTLDRFVATAGRDEARRRLVVKAINTSPNSVLAEMDFGDVKFASGHAEAIVLTSADLQDNNSLDDPQRVVPIASTINVPGSKFEHEFPPRSLTVLCIPTE